MRLTNSYKWFGPAAPAPEATTCSRTTVTPAPHGYRRFPSNGPGPPQLRTDFECGIFAPLHAARTRRGRRAPRGDRRRPPAAQLATPAPPAAAASRGGSRLERGLFLPVRYPQRLVAGGLEPPAPVLGVLHLLLHHLAWVFLGGGLVFRLVSRLVGQGPGWEWGLGRCLVGRCLV